MKTQVCVRCNESRPLDAFTKNVTKKHGRNPACRPCHSKWQKRHYLENKAYYIEKASAYAKELRQLVITAKSKPCADCGKSYPYYVMDLDHRNGSEKSFELAQAALSGRTKVLEEIAKCDPVCSNCHRERTQRRRLVANAGIAQW